MQTVVCKAQKNAMTQVEDQSKNTLASKIILLSAAITFVFWLCSKLIDVYKFVFLGVVFEILWLPILALTFIIPLLSLALWVKTKFDFKSYYFYSFLISVLTILIFQFLY